MKIFIYLIMIGILISACVSVRNNGFDSVGNSDIKNDTVRIANDSLEYEIIIYEPGFQTFLVSQAQPRGYYSQSVLENRNRILVQEYNQRVIQPQRYDPELYPQQIDFNPRVDYGYEVNYLLYNYFVYFSRKYNQKFPAPTRV